MGNFTPTQASDLRRIMGALDRVLGANDDQLIDRGFVLDVVSSFGVAFQDWALLGQFQSYVNASEYGLLQIPTEVADYLLCLRGRTIRSACEVGVCTGIFSVLCAAYLKRTCGLEEYHCIDLEDHFPQKDQFQRKVPLIFHFGKTSDDLCGEPYDLVFIDGDHSYMWMKKDFLNIGRYANICCFHDIKAHEYDHLGGGTVRCWRELKESYREKASIIEISHSGPYWMGIGMIFLSEPIRGETSALLRSAQEHKGNIGR